jgi:ACS family hexuronate transporter-like MFS transporter
MLARASTWKWWVTCLLLLATTINYMDRVTLANASVRVTQEFGLSEEQYGNLELAFGWAFALGSIVFGFLADRFPLYWLYPVTLAGWSVMGMISGWTADYTQLLLCRTLLGFFEAGHWPCALKTTLVVLTEKDRTMGNSVLQSGASIGAVITPQVMKWLMTDELGSWRSAFVAVGAFGLLWVVIWLWMMRDGRLGDTPVRARSAMPQALGQILVSRRFWALALLITGTQSVWHIYRVWLMKFLQTGRGYSEEAALNFQSAYYVSTDVGCFLAGALSLWLVRNKGLNAHEARRSIYFGACLLTSMSLSLPWLSRGPILLAALLLIGAGALALFPCYYGFVQELSAEHVGRLTGLLSMWVWAVTSPLHKLFGWIADSTKSYDAGLVVAGLAPWLGVWAMKTLWVRQSPDVDGAAT